MKKRNLLIAVAILVTMLIGCDNSNMKASTGIQEDAAQETAEGIIQEELKLNQIENIFAFGDESGKRLITLGYENGVVLSNPEAFNLAIGNNGEIYHIKFVKQQQANSMDTLRQTIYNFDNMAGYIFEAVEGKFALNKTYLLAMDSKLNRNAFIQLISTRDMESKTTSYKQAGLETIKKVEEIKNRKVTKSSLISKTVDNTQICLFVFERKEDDMLASIAYINEDKVIFRDYPAKYDELSTWRVDAGDEPGLFEVLFLAKSDEGLLLGITWAGPEGENIFVLKEKEGVFEETDLISGRYWAP